MKLIKKIKSNEGGIAINTAILTPFILLICYIVLDLLYVNNQKASIQRKTDSASLAIVANTISSEDDNIYVDPLQNLIKCYDTPTGDANEFKTTTLSGTRYCSYILSGDNEKILPCEITREYYEKGIEQLKKDLPLTSYDEQYFDEHYSWDKLSDEYKKNLKQGIVSFKYPAKVYSTLSNFGGFSWSYEVKIESQAVCNSKLKEKLFYEKR